MEQHWIQTMLSAPLNFISFLLPQQRLHSIQKSFDWMGQRKAGEWMKIDEINWICSSISSLSLFLMAQCGPTKQRWDEWACRGNLSCLGAPLVCLLSAPSTIFSISLQRKLTAAKTNCATFISFNSTNCFHFVQSIVSLGLLSWLCLFLSPARNQPNQMKMFHWFVEGARQPTIQLLSLFLTALWRADKIKRKLMDLPRSCCCLVCRLRRAGNANQTIN